MNPITGKLASAVCMVLCLGSAGVALAADLTHEANSGLVADARRETLILAGFNANPKLHAYDLTVIVDADKASLGGAVESTVARDLAGQIAMRADGIVQIDNRIEVDAGAVPLKREASGDAYGASANDRAVSTSVKSRLSWNALTEGLDVRVDTRDGRVTLAGTAISYAERDMAGSVARDTDGVTEVSNELVLADQPRPIMLRERDGEQAGRAPSDSWITSRIKSSFRLTRGVSRFDIAVTTSNGIVSLSGMVPSRAERELAVQVAQDTRGVKQVDADGLVGG